MKTKLDFTYFNKNKVYTSNVDEQYFFCVFSGANQVQVEQGDCCFYLNEDKTVANVKRGPASFVSKHFAVIVRGYAPPNKTSQIMTSTNLPYINGCSTRQLFPPERPGDPTWQLLRMPQNVKEQKHHIHPTARVVYVLSGNGRSIVGTPGHLVKTNLRAGMICVIGSMVPHHFETINEELIVLPVHIWSSVSGHDFNHPMYNGTLEI